jgi:DNA-binding MarR family transcriptional regulator
MLVALLEAAHELQVRVDRALAELDLSYPRFDVLNILVDAGEAMSMSELSDRLACVRSNVTQLVDHLEANGLVQRVSDPADRRILRAAITPRGEERQAMAARVFEEVQADFTEKLSDVERAALERALSALK